MLFDSTFFIDYAKELRGLQRSSACRSFLQQHRHVTKYVSVVTMGEYAVGATISETLRFFRGWQRLALGRELALFAGRLQSRLSFELGENDLWIVATALHQRMPIVSRDQTLALVPGLHVIGY